MNWETPDNGKGGRDEEISGICADTVAEQSCREAPQGSRCGVGKVDVL